MRQVLIAACLAGACSAATPEVQPTPEPAQPGPSATATAAPSSGEPSGATSPRLPVESEEGTLLHRLMKSHFVQVAKIRSAVIAGEIDRAIEPARTIVEMQGVDTLPDVWRSSVRELQAASARISQSPDLAEAAAATADIGMTCGGCHTQNGGPVAIASTPAPDGDTVAGRMKRHLWATEKLWEGLYVPSDQAWEDGAQALATEPLANDVLAPGGVHARHFATELATLAKKAQATKDGEERARIYAGLLATCSPCHAAVRKQ